jgi:hypothetical protein
LLRYFAAFHSPALTLYQDIPKTTHTKMKHRHLNSLPALLAASVALSAAPASAATLVSNDFGAAADTGPAFQQLYNGQGTASADPATGTITTTGVDNASIGLNTLNSVDASTAPGFTIEWVVSSFTNTGNITFNGFFFGVTNDTGSTGASLWNNAPEAVGILLDGGSTHPDWSLVERTGDPTNGTLSASTGLGGTANDFSVSDNDGFTLSLTINNDDTWSAFSTGMANDISASGTLAANSYATLSGSLVANTTIQGSGVGYTIDSVTLSTIPEPSAATLIGGVLFLGLLRRRRGA